MTVATPAGAAAFGNPTQEHCMLSSRPIRFAAPVLALAALAVPGVVPAHAQSKPPAGRLFGFVQVDDHGAYDGTTVAAYVNSSFCGQASYDANRGLYIIDLDSSNDDCDTADATVWFTVG